MAAEFVRLQVFARDGRKSRSRVELRGVQVERMYHEMTELYVIPVTKAILDSMPEDVRVFFVQAGRLHNEAMWLQKLILASQQHETTNEILTGMQTYQALMLTRLLAGKLWEGWDLLNRSYFGAKLSRHYEQRLPTVGQEAIAALKKYFGKKGLMQDVRNNFAFHYSPERIRAILTDLEEPGLKIYLSEQSGNTFFQFSETIVNIAMLEGIQKGDYKAALDKLMNQVGDVARDFVTFCDAWIGLVLQEYFPEITDLDKLEKVTLSDLPKIEDIGLNYFIS